MRLVNPLVRSPQVPAPNQPDATAEPTTPSARRYELLVKVAVAAVLAVSVVLRFWTPSALWLDEALTVNISAAPLHEIPALLRHDGAPPLYYYLLHFWIEAFGTGNLAVRSLAGVCGVVTIPLAWLAGYRVGSRWWLPAADEPAANGADDLAPAALDRRGRVVGWTLALLVATSPFAVYYSTEARMYAFVMLLSTIGLLAVLAVLRRPSVWNAVAVAVVTSALLYTHYWALYLVLVAGAGAVYCGLRGPHRRQSWVIFAALAIGSLTFVPWLPTFWFQVNHTGTPWAMTADFTALVFTFTQFAGGNSDAGRGLALLFGFLGLLGVAGSALDRRRVVVDLRTRPGVRALFALTVATLAVAVVAGKVAGSTFASRYTSVVAVFGLLVVAYGVVALADRHVRDGVIAVAVALGLAASIPNAFIERTQAGQVAAGITATARPGDVVAYCPDQLGPAVARLLDVDVEQYTFPRLAPPQIVDWVNYDQVIAAASPQAFAQQVIDRAGPHAIYYVWANDYLGFGGDCQQIANVFANERATSVIVSEQQSDTPFEIYEGENLFRYTPR